MKTGDQRRITLSLGWKAIDRTTDGWPDFQGGHRTNKPSSLAARPTLKEEGSLAGMVAGAIGKNMEQQDTL